MYSKHEGKEFGAFVRTAGKFFNDEEQDKGKRALFIDKIDLLDFAVHLRVTSTLTQKETRRRRDCTM